jgi:ketosteroid isomerase-like protein
VRTTGERRAAAGVAEANGSPGAAGAGPGETVLAFTRALVGGDAETATSYFSPLARLLTPDGTEVSGRSPIGQLLNQLVTPDQRLEIRTGRILRAGSVALCNQFWTRSSRAAAGEGFESATTARLVLQRDREDWQIMIAAPWG